MIPRVSRTHAIAVLAANLFAAASFLIAGTNPTTAQAAAPQSTAQALTADQVIEKVIAARRTSGFRVHAKLTRSTAALDSAKDVRQLLIKSRRDGEATKTLYQVLWPTKFAGEAILIEDSGDHQVKGFLFRNGAATPLTNQSLEGEFFGSDIHIEDAVEGFWYWPSRKSAGEETIDKRRCMIVELRPGPDTVTQYSMVKAWVAPEISLAMKIQVYGRDGKLVKTVTTDRVVKEGKLWLAATVKVLPVVGKTQTVLEGTKSERDLQLPAADFTIEAIKNFGKAGR
ncbi:MAG: outer membrane lipoprotein-sorting protein [Candidatus Acidiferrales bacterium]